MSHSFLHEVLIKTDPCNTQLRAEFKSTNTDSSTAVSFGKSVSRLRFFASIPRIHQVDGVEHVVPKHECCEFKMGIGPCGRDVVGLWFKLSRSFLTITQASVTPNSSDIEHKEFTYLIPEITGRIEATSV